MQATESASSTDVMETNALKMEQVVQKGDEYLTSGEYDKAIGAFQTAISAAAQAYTEATMRMELRKILPAMPLQATSTIGVDIEAAMEEQEDRGKKRNGGDLEVDL